MEKCTRHRHGCSHGCFCRSVVDGPNQSGSGCHSDGYPIELPMATQTRCHASAGIIQTHRKHQHMPMPKNLVPSIGLTPRRHTSQPFHSHNVRACTHSCDLYAAYYAKPAAAAASADKRAAGPPLNGTRPRAHIQQCRVASRCSAPRIRRAFPLPFA